MSLVEVLAAVAAVVVQSGATQDRTAAGEPPARQESSRVGAARGRDRTMQERSAGDRAAAEVREQLGVELAVTESRLRRRIISTRTPYGFLIRRVTPGSAAERAGLEAGDVLRTWDGAPIREVEELARWARESRAGRGGVPIEYSRKRPNVPLTFPATDPWESRRTRVRPDGPTPRRFGPI